MIQNPIKQLWDSGKPAIGTFLELGSPLAAEIIADIGFDWVIIDTEHGSFDIETTFSIIHSIRTTKSVPLVRVPFKDTIWIRRSLDAGAYGVVIPMIKTPEDAEKAVQAAKYPPRGVRGFGGPRTRLYGGLEYYEKANQETLVIVQIETIEAVQNIDEILAVEGIDAYFIGPNDLSLSLGLKPLTDNSANPVFIEAVDKIFSAGQKHGVGSGIQVGTPEAANQRISQGFKLISYSTEANILRLSALSAFNEINH